MIGKISSLLALAICGVSTVLGEDPKTLMTERGKVLYSEDFARLDTKVWHAAKGKWEIADGAVKGSELKSDNHPGVLRHQFAFQDAIIQFDVCVNGCKQATFSINDSKGHLARVLFTEKGFAAQKDDHDHAGPDKAVVFGRTNISFKAGEWHTVLIEFKGEEMVTTVDGKTIAGAHPVIATQKANVGFTVVGESVSYRKLKVWEALAKPSWEETKKQLSAANK